MSRYRESVEKFVQNERRLALLDLADTVKRQTAASACQKQNEEHKRRRTILEAQVADLTSQMSKLNEAESLVQGKLQQCQSELGSLSLQQQIQREIAIAAVRASVTPTPALVVTPETPALGIPESPPFFDIPRAPTLKTPTVKSPTQRASTVRAPTQRAATLSRISSPLTQTLTTVPDAPPRDTYLTNASGTLVNGVVSGGTGQVYKTTTPIPVTRGMKLPLAPVTTPAQKRALNIAPVVKASVVIKRMEKAEDCEVQNLLWDPRTGRCIERSLLNQIQVGAKLKSAACEKDKYKDENGACVRCPAGQELRADGKCHLSTIAKSEPDSAASEIQRRRSAIAGDENDDALEEPHEDWD